MHVSHIHIQIPFRATAFRTTVGSIVYTGLRWQMFQLFGSMIGARGSRFYHAFRFSNRMRSITFRVMPIVSTTKMKANHFLQLGEDPPGVRLELVDGEVAVSPSVIPEHSYVVMTLGWILNSYIIPNDLGELHHDVDTILDGLECASSRHPLLFQAAVTFDRQEGDGRPARPRDQKC